MKLSDLFAAPFEYDQTCVNAIEIRDSGGDIVCEITQGGRDVDERDLFLAEKLVTLLNDAAESEDDE
jgi:hypothetical protein